MIQTYRCGSRMPRTVENMFNKSMEVGLPDFGNCLFVSLFVCVLSKCVAHQWNWTASAYKRSGTRDKAMQLGLPTNAVFQVTCPKNLVRTFAIDV